MTQRHDDFVDKTVLVTGGAAGIGKAIALMFAQRGASVIVSDISEETGQSTCDEIRASGGDALFVKTDVTQPDDCEHLIQQTLSHYGRLDAAVNNAGIIGELAFTADCSLDNWRKVLDINLTGIFNCLSREIAAMKGKGGAIVNMSSILGLVGGLGVAAYSASKHGVIGLTKSSAMEYGQHNIRVNAVCPGYVDTSMVGNNRKVLATAENSPLGRLGNPDEIAETVLWLCSERASFVTGAAFTVDGGVITG